MTHLVQITNSLATIIRTPRIVADARQQRVPFVKSDSKLSVTLVTALFKNCNGKSSSVSKMRPVNRRVTLVTALSYIFNSATGKNIIPYSNSKKLLQLLHR